MKHWFWIEDCTSTRSAVYTEELKASTATEAFIEAAGKWEALTAADRDRRDDAYIGYAETDDDGCVDYDTMTEIYSFRDGRKPVFYLLDDLDGYGAEHPMCSGPIETARLLTEWAYQYSDDPLPDCWHRASRREIEEYGTYEG